MNELKEDFEKGRYIEILDKTEGKKDPSSLYFRLVALLSLSRGEEAMGILEKHREDLFAAYPLETLKSDFSLRFLRKEFDEAEEDYKTFSNYPYQSQDVEEALRDIPKAIAIAKKNASLPQELGIKEIRNILSSNDGYAIISLLENLDENDFPAFSKEITSLLINENVHQLVRTYALIYLKGVRYRQEVEFLYAGERRKYVPDSLDAPYKDDRYKRAIAFISSSLDPSVYRAAKNLLDRAVLLTYPTSFLNEGDESAKVSAIVELAYEYLRIATKAPRYKNPDEAAVKEAKKEIAALLGDQ